MMDQTPQEPPKTPFDGPQKPQGAPQLRSAQTLVTIATISGPVSLLIGGVMLSTIGLVCAIMALVKANGFLKEPGEDQWKVIASRIRRSSVLAVIVCALALILNAMTVASVMPAMMEAVQSGDLTSLYESYGMAPSGGSGSTGSGGSSAWG
ncbi:MAG: hypothetical protein HFJ75_06230 [Eggerthellaceae bacterium]|nr:hypothetical protein [Eggerthellaceae bacterium]